MQIDLREVIYVLSGALDFVGVSDVRHGKRVAYMAHAMGRALGLSGPALDDLFEAALLHDAGVSTTREHDKLVSQYTFLGVHWHCMRGQDLLLRFPPLAHLAPLVAFHHTPWTEFPEGPRAPTPIQRLSANIIYLADRVDALLGRRQDVDPLLLRDDILETLSSRYRTAFAPEVLEAFRAASACDAFWFGLDPEALSVELAPLACNGRTATMTPQELTELATLFAHIVDAKSPFTAEHSAGVGRVSAHLAGLAGLSTERRNQVEVAALLHDVGKLRIPDDILDKPGPLDRGERARMNRHSYYTHQILRQIRGFDDIALWASHHHETLDGGGYPFGTGAERLPLEVRIIAVSDVFQALAQTRPYRAALPPEETLAIVQRLAQSRKLDSDVVSLVTDNIDALWAKATVGAG